MPYRVIYPDNQGNFKSEIPFGSKLPYKANGAVKITSDLSFNDLSKILRGLVNVPYKWGGKTSMGFDCSGLIQSVLNCFGPLVPRDSVDQFQYFESDKIAIEDAQVGDLHFFGVKQRVNHVGFSLGGKSIIHSQGCVKVESLDEKDTNYNKNLTDIYLSTHSIRRIFSI